MCVSSRLFCALGLIAGFTAQAVSAEYLEGNERQKSRAYSPADITEGGRIVCVGAHPEAFGSCGIVSRYARALKTRRLTASLLLGSDSYVLILFLLSSAFGTR